ATVFYVLLPADSGVSYLTILSVLLLAQLASLASQVPAGLGVLESVVMLFLSPMIAASTLFGALLAYRAIYFLLPFCIAILMLLVHETRLRGRKTMKHLTPKEAFQKTKEGHVYLDVRTTEEFKKGHPKGAVNIPVFIAGPAGRELNPNFLAKVKEQFDKNAKLVVGCHSGGRSAKACEILISEGFAHVVNCKGSFGGGPDPETGEPVKGWKDEGLPVE
ncbi:MAG: rhodanese-like domain-containing protein, partial [bacterium]|nr:rhodanese-like domain-containing protein [bacterium]